MHTLCCIFSSIVAINTDLLKSSNGLPALWHPGDKCGRSWGVVITSSLIDKITDSDKAWHLENCNFLDGENYVKNFKRRTPPPPFFAAPHKYTHTHTQISRKVKSSRLINLYPKLSQSRCKLGELDGRMCSSSNQSFCKIASFGHIYRYMYTHT